MKKQLLLSKRLFLEGTVFSERQDPISCGIAISLFQDAVELLVWALIKEGNIQAKEGSSFTQNIDALGKAGFQLTNRAQIFELNKARVNFKHYGNLPAPEEAVKFQLYAENFLRSSFEEHFHLSFEQLSLVDLLSSEDVKEHLRAAEEMTAASQYAESMTEAAKAKALIFKRLERLIPPVSRDLRHLDSLIPNELRSARVFSHLVDYLEVLREASLSALLRLPPKEFAFVRAELPAAFQYGDGRWQVTAVGFRTESKPRCDYAVSCLVNLSLRMEAIL